MHSGNVRVVSIWGCTKRAIRAFTLSGRVFTVFLMPYEIVTGGVTGMSAVIYYATGFKIQNTYMIINIS